MNIRWLLLISVLACLPFKAAAQSIPPEAFGLAGYVLSHDLRNITYGPLGSIYASPLPDRALMETTLQYQSRDGRLVSQDEFLREVWRNYPQSGLP